MRVKPAVSELSFLFAAWHGQESYEYAYPAPGSPDLAKRIVSLLAEEGIHCSTDALRGWDHGVFVPLMLMFPKAPVVRSPSLVLGWQADPTRI